MKCYYSQAFWVKITTLPLALVFTYAVRQQIAEAGGTPRALSVLTGAVSIVLWFTVAAAGRWIGYS